MHSRRAFIKAGMAATMAGVMPALGATKTTGARRLPERGLCAHRGAMHTHPENTVPALQEAIRMGAHMIEFDLQLTSDGVLVLMHDETVDRTTDGHGRVSELSYSSLRKLDAGRKKGPGFAGTRIPAFDQVLELMPRNVWLNCHIKGPDQVAVQAARSVLDAGREHQAFLAATRTQAAAARAFHSGILICNMGRRPEQAVYARETIEMGAQFIQLRAKDGSPKDVLDPLLKAGIRVNCYPAGTPDEICDWLRWGVHFPLVNDIVTAIPVAMRCGTSPQVPQF